MICCCSYIEVKIWFRVTAALFSSKGFAEFTVLKYGLATDSWDKYSGPEKRNSTQYSLGTCDI